jgi:hypothetical protein
VRFEPSTTLFGNDFNQPLVFLTNNTEQMRLTSTGLGIGTSSPSQTLNVKGIGLFEGTAQGNVIIQKTGTNGVSLFSDAAGKLAFYDQNAGTTRLTLDSSGNLGLGVTPSVWNSAYKALQVGTGIAVGGVFGRTDGINEINFGLNWTYTGGASLTYVASSSATNYAQKEGQHQWFTAASGTAGNAISFTQAMTLTASGNQLLGTTVEDAGFRLKIVGGNLLLGENSTSSESIYIGSNAIISSSGGGAPLRFGIGGTESARIDSSGNLIQTAPTTPPSLATNGQMVFNLTSNTNLRVSVRGSDGVTRTANITLA